MKNTIYTTIGASNHSGTARKEHDFYATYPEAIDRLFEVEKFPDTIWEPACGMGHLSKRMIELGKKVHSTDLINRGYGTGGVDFLKATETLMELSLPIHHEKSMSFLPALLLPKAGILLQLRPMEMQSPMPGSCGKKVYCSGLDKLKYGAGKQ